MDGSDYMPSELVGHTGCHAVFSEIKLKLPPPKRRRLFVARRSPLGKRYYCFLNQQRQAEGEEERMARRCAILQKKVEELESDLANLLHNQSAKTAPQPYNDDDFYKAIDGKFAFARRLLSAEMIAHRPHKQPQQLHHIAQRLTVLEALLLKWVHLQTSPSDGMDVFFACSCSCSSEEAETSDDLGSVLEEDEEKCQECVSWEAFVDNRIEGDKEEDLETFSCKEFEETAPEAVVRAQEDLVVVARETKDEKRSWTGKSGRLMSGFVFAVLVGVVTAAVSFSCETHNHVENVFLVPT